MPGQGGCWHLLISLLGPAWECTGWPQVVAFGFPTAGTGLVPRVFILPGHLCSGGCHPVAWKVSGDWGKTAFRSGTSFGSRHPLSLLSSGGASAPRRLSGCLLPRRGLSNGPDGRADRDLGLWAMAPCPQPAWDVPPCPGVCFHPPPAPSGPAGIGRPSGEPSVLRAAQGCWGPHSQPPGETRWEPSHGPAGCFNLSWQLSNHGASGGGSVMGCGDVLCAE